MSESNGNGRKPRILQRLPSGIKVGIGLPTGGQWVPDFGMDFGQMMAWSAAVVTLELGVDFVPLKREGTYTEDARNMIARAALQESCTHLLWLDTDMRFPRDTMYRLLQRRQPIVGANYSTRMPPFYPTALAMEKNADGSERLWTDADATGLTPCHAIGHGVLMVETEVYRRIPAPWYQNFWVDADNLVGEDVFFCRGARQAGLEIWVDNDLSHLVAHCGAMQFNLAFARQYRDTELAMGRLHPEAEAHAVRHQPTERTEDTPTIEIVR